MSQSHFNDRPKIDIEPNDSIIRNVIIRQMSWYKTERQAEEEFTLIRLTMRTSFQSSIESKQQYHSQGHRILFTRTCDS